MFDLFKNTLLGVRGNTTVCKPVGMRKLSGLGRNLEPQKIMKFSIHNVTVSCVDRGCYKPPSHLYSAMSFGIDGLYTHTADDWDVPLSSSRSSITTSFLHPSVPVFPACFITCLDHPLISLSHGTHKDTSACANSWCLLSSGDQPHPTFWLVLSATRQTA